jgi:hypothetical protein
MLTNLAPDDVMPLVEHMIACCRCLTAELLAAG